MTKTLTTKIDGKEYRVHLVTMSDGRKVVWVRGVRVMEDGSKVEAFLSARQYKAENRVKRLFAKDISAHICG